MIGDVTGLQSVLDLKATQSDIDTAIDGIEIGGRNYLRNSSTTKHVEAGAAISHYNWFNVDTLKGNSIYFSMEVFNVVGFTQMHIGIYNLTKSTFAVDITACPIVNGKVKRGAWQCQIQLIPLRYMCMLVFMDRLLETPMTLSTKKAEIGNKSHRLDTSTRRRINK